MNKFNDPTPNYFVLAIAGQPDRNNPYNTKILCMRRQQGKDQQSKWTSFFCGFTGKGNTVAEKAVAVFNRKLGLLDEAQLDAHDLVNQPLLNGPGVYTVEQYEDQTKKQVLSLGYVICLDYDQDDLEHWPETADVTELRIMTIREVLHACQKGEMAYSGVEDKFISELRQRIESYDPDAFHAPGFDLVYPY